MAGSIVGNLINVLVFILKGWFMVFVMMWIRWTLPRLRIDQVMMTCLKYLLPLSCVLLLGVSVWRLVMPTLVQQCFRYVLCGLCLVGVVFFIRTLMAFASAPRIPENTAFEARNSSVAMLAREATAPIRMNSGMTESEYALASW